MRRIVTGGLFVAAALAFAGSVHAQAATAASASPTYVGVAKCKMCHTTEKIGNQHGKWAASAHSKAYTILATPEALKIAKAKGIDAPQTSDKCLKCHTAAFGVDAKLVGTLTKEEGVSCEACHGPGSGYKAMATMKNRQLAVAAGLVIPGEKNCVKCHNAESPTFKAFAFKEMCAKIAHPVPPAASAPKEAK